MSNYLSLVKVFLRSLSMRDADDKKKKAINKILVGFVSIFVMLPFALICMFLKTLPRNSFFHNFALWR